MCGIAGIVTRKPRDPGAARSLVERALGRLRHRGPDDSGLATCVAPDGGSMVVLGHRRLAIVDVAGGHQPMEHADGSALAFNGEIYNFESLRPTCVEVPWRTRSDTEVLLQLLHSGVTRALPTLNGMFAFGYWDAAHRTLWLARDGGGEKPLYYAATPDGLAFASELHALLGLLEAPVVPDRAAVAGYLQLGYFASPSTALAGVSKLEPGQWLCWRDGRIEKGFFWTPFAPGPSMPLGDDELLALVEDCVRSRLIGERRLGVFLSGGIDSSLVAALVARVLGADKTLTFSIGFDDPAFDETRYSAAVSGRLGTRHHHQQVALADLRDVIAAALEAQDEPSADASFLPTYLLSRFAAGHVTVSLSGDGGDELFAGYRTHALHRLVQGLGRVPGVLPLLRCTPLSRERGHWLIANGPTAMLRRHLDSVGLFLPAEVQAWFPQVAAGTAFEQAWSGQLAVRARPMDLGDILRLDFRYYLGDGVLQKVDRASMAHSLEVRAPLLDRRLVDHALGLPPDEKFRGVQGKAPLRRLLAKLIPGAGWNQRKQGFSVPLDRWFREGLIEDLRGSADDLEFWGLPGSGVPIEIARAAPASRVPHRLWALLTLAAAARRYR